MLSLSSSLKKCFNKNYDGGLLNCTFVKELVVVGGGGLVGVAGSPLASKARRPIRYKEFISNHKLQVLKDFQLVKSCHFFLY